MKKKLLTITLTALLLLSVAALGISTVFRVERVTLDARLTARAGVTAEDLQEELKSAYERESIFSVDEKKAEEIVKKYPYLRVVRFEKGYPSGLTVTVVEDSETYAVAAENGYYILNSEGIVVEFRAEANNRVDNAPNLLIEGLTVTGKVGEVLTGDPAWQTTFALCNAVDKSLDGIRRNVVRIEVLSRSPQTFYLLTMREGVKIYIEEPALSTEEKGKVAIEKYLSLSDGERIAGRITVRLLDGRAVAEYKNVDEF